MKTTITAIALTIATATTAVAHVKPQARPVDTPPAWACGAKGYVFEGIPVEGGIIHQRWYCDDGRKTQQTIIFDTGPDNSPSNVGPAGRNGTNGTNGTNGATGATGERGPKGPKGDKGPQGNNGTNGATGATGERGPKGPKGDKGPQGNNGVNGTSSPGGSGGHEQGPGGDDAVT